VKGVIKTATVSLLLLLADSDVLDAQFQWTLPSAAISVRNASNGNVLIDLNWMITGYCQAFAPIFDPSLTVSAQTVSISTVNGFFDCPPPPPPPPPPASPVPLTPVAAHITAMAGDLPDGHYFVVWSFTNYHSPNYPPPIAPVMGDFYVISGRAVLTPSAIPALSPSVLLLLAISLGLLACKSLR